MFNAHSSVPVFCLMALLGIECLDSHGAAAVPLSTIEMGDYRGGYVKYCTDAVKDPNAIHCYQCTSNGNGGSVRCTSTNDSMIDQFNASAQNYRNYDQTPCGQNSYMWNAPITNCPNNIMPSSQGNCGRNYIAASAGTYYGGNCNP